MSTIQCNMFSVIVNFIEKFELALSEDMLRESSLTNRYKGSSETVADDSGIAVVIPDNCK